MKKILIGLASGLVVGYLLTSIYFVQKIDALRAENNADIIKIRKEYDGFISSASKLKTINEALNNIQDQEIKEILIKNGIINPTPIMKTVEEFLSGTPTPTNPFFPPKEEPTQMPLETPTPTPYFGSEKSYYQNGNYIYGQGTSYYQNSNYIYGSGGDSAYENNGYIYGANGKSCYRNGSYLYCN
jgi:hypothetical protein